MYRVAIICSFSISAKNICHVLQEEIEKKHNQDVWANNVDGKGIKFTFTLERSN